MANSSYRGLPNPTRKGGKPALISRITRLEVHYTVQWPLNVIVSDDQIHTYQQIFPVLLQVSILHELYEATLPHLSTHPVWCCRVSIPTVRVVRVSIPIVRARL
jgi:Gamma tubulin complex component C-terminal